MLIYTVLWDHTHNPHPPVAGNVEVSPVAATKAGAPDMCESSSLGDTGTLEHGKREREHKDGSHQSLSPDHGPQIRCLPLRMTPQGKQMSFSHTKSGRIMISHSFTWALVCVSPSMWAVFWAISQVTIVLWVSWTWTPMVFKARCFGSLFPGYRS